METLPLIAKPKRKSLWDWLQCCICPYFQKRKKLHSRIIKLGEIPEDKFSPNNISNQKYSILTFFPLVLYQQFKFFLNLYFLIMALSQFIPEIQIGYLYTYWGPLIFVISITIFREAYDDIRRYRRDKCINSERYETLILDGEDKGSSKSVTGSSLQVGDILLLHRGQRVPADLLLLRTTDRTGSIFIATDQLDGETDWKVRIAVSGSQKATRDSDLLDMDVTIFAEQPQSDIHSFIGTWTNTNSCEDHLGLQVQNMLWAGTVLESSHATGVVIYTGAETRSVMNNSFPRSKVGQFDLKVNDMIKVLFIAVILLSILMVSLKGFNGPWFRYLCRFVLLFSYIIPISVRVNLEIGKTFYAWQIKRDKYINGTVMRTTTIPEEMGRVSYLLADKTGTVTKNEMAFKKFSIINSCYDERNFHEVETLLTQHITREGSSLPATPIDSCTSINMFSEQSTYTSGRQIWEAVLGMALCHNVTPVYDREDGDAGSVWNDDDAASSYVSESRGGAVPQQQLCNYQAASPDEVALVKWTDFMGVSLYNRDLTSISLKLRATNEIVNYAILYVFPFTSETKYMGIIVKDNETNVITYYVKGADTVLQTMVGSPHWLKTQSTALANEGLRTLIFAKRRLTTQEFEEFKEHYELALGVTHNRMERLEHCISYLNTNLQLLSITGVEDHLADDAALTIDILRKAGIKIWMLTGDKLETALCISKSLHLMNEVERDVFVFQNCSRRVDTHSELLRLQEARGASLIIDGESFDSCLKWYCEEFSKLALECSAVVVARCSPTQKAEVVCLLKQYSKGSVCAVGDGGNDVPMIQEADIGIGLEGKEGRAAALAGDVSTMEFRSLSRLLLIHGRRSRLRSSTLSFFVIHRGLVISTMQAIFSTVFYFSAVSIYQGFLMVGYGTFFTMLPVISLVLDKDISSKDALESPVLYKGLVKQRMFSYKMFFMWVAISIYQGGILMYGALIAFEDEFINIVSISFTALIITELLMIILIINTWHRFIILAEILSVLIYIIAAVIFPQYIDGNFIKTFDCLYKVTLITLISWMPLCLLKLCYTLILRRNSAKKTNIS